MMIVVIDEVKGTTIATTKTRNGDDVASRSAALSGDAIKIGTMASTATTVGTVGTTATATVAMATVATATAVMAMADMIRMSSTADTSRAFKLARATASATRVTTHRDRT